MNRNVKIAIGIVLGIGVIYLGYRFLYKGSENEGTDTSKENLVHDKASREVILVENN
jgi:cadmium resistance protein CadD (predicted permease)